MTRKNLIFTWFRTCRPKTLPAAVAPIIMGLSMASTVVQINLTTALFTLITALLIQIGTNLINDYYDVRRGSDPRTRQGPVRGLQQGILTAAHIKTAAVTVYLGAFLGGGYLVIKGGGVPILTIGLLSLLSGYLYTGGPKPLAYLGVADIFVVLFFGVLAVCGTFYLQTGTVYAETVLASPAPGLLSTAVLTVNNIRDLNDDRAAGKKTLAVRFGQAFAEGKYIFCLSAPFMITFCLALFFRQKSVLLTFFSIVPAVYLGKQIFKKQGKELNRILAGTGVLLLFYAGLFSLGWLL